MSKSYSAKPGEIERQWVVVDVEGQVLGRAATEIAMILRGKHRPTFTPHVDTGDFVVVVNAEKVKLTGKKTTDKKYYTHSGYIGSLRATTAGQLLKEHPDRVFRAAVRGMLPKNTLGRSLLKKLKIYAGPDHPHAAQKPTPHRLSAKE